MNELALGCMSMCKSNVEWPIDAHASPPFSPPECENIDRDTARAVLVRDFHE
jgi:hypothetical protein